MPARYWQELNAAAITGIVLKNHYVLLYEEEEEEEEAEAEAEEEEDDDDEKDEEEETELACVGAGLGGGFENTMELHAMN